jgi:Suppressor of fused protein (SUFU)
MIRRSEAMTRGTIIGPRGRLFAGGNMTALYAAEPAYLRDGFARCAGAPPIDLLWLVPITDTEADFARTHGRQAFEDAREHEDPDLSDPNRRQRRAAH